MARRYSPGASKVVARAMRKRKRGTLRNAHERWQRKEGDEPQAGDRDRALGSAPTRQEIAGAARVGKLVRDRGGAGSGQEAVRLAPRRKISSEPHSSAPVPVWEHEKSVQL